MDLVYQGDRDLNLDNVDFDVDVPRADAVLGPHFGSNNPDLRRFKQRGGKLILYHGWNDPLVSAYDTIDYYHRVAATVGAPDTAGTEHIQDFSRLFLAPGMGHCVLLPGPGPYRHDALGALERWVEYGEGPDKLIVSNPETSMSRPLCPYPQVASYKGSGSTGKAASFECMVPER